MLGQTFEEGLPEPFFCLVGHCHGLMSGGMCWVCRVDASGEKLQFRGFLCPPDLVACWGLVLALWFFCAGYGGGGPTWVLVEQEGGCWEKSAPCAWGLASVQKVWPFTWACLADGLSWVKWVKNIVEEHLSHAREVYVPCWVQLLPCLLYGRAAICPYCLGCLQCN